MLRRLCSRTRQHSSPGWRKHQHIQQTIHPRYKPSPPSAHPFTAQAVAPTPHPIHDSLHSLQEWDNSPTFNEPTYLPPNTATTKLSTAKPGLIQHADEEVSRVRMAIHDLIITPRPRASAVRKLQQLMRTIQSKNLLSDQRVTCSLAGAMIHLDMIPMAYKYVYTTSPRGQGFNLWIFEEYILTALEDHNREDWVHKFAYLAKSLSGQFKPSLIRRLANAYVQLNEFKRLQNLLDIADKEGVAPDQTTLELIVRGHMSNSDPESAAGVMKRMADLGMEVGASVYAAILSGSRGFGLSDSVDSNLKTISPSRPTAEVLNAELRLLLDAESFDRFDDTLHRFNFNTSAASPSHPHPLPNERTWRLLLEASIQRRDSLDQTLHLFARCVNAGNPPTPVLISLLLRAYASHGAVKEAVQIVSLLCRTHLRYSKAIEPLISKLENLVDSQPSSKPIRHPFDPSSVQLNIVIINAILQELAHDYGLQAVEALLQIIHFFHFKPNAETTKLILQSASHTFDDPPKLTNIADRLIDKCPLDKSALSWNGSTLNLSTHNYLLSRYILAEERKVHNSRSWVRTRPRARLPTALQEHDTPDLESPSAGINTRASAYYRTLNRLTGNLRARGVRSSHRTLYLRMRRDAVNRMDVASASSVLKSMQARGIRPRLSHYRALALGHGLQGDMAGVKRCIRAYEKDFKPEFSNGKEDAGNVSMARMGVGVGSVILWSLLVIAYGKLGRPDLAQATFEEMVSEGVVPDALAVQRLAKSHFINGDVVSAKKAILDFWPADTVGALTHEICCLPLKRLTQVLMEKDMEASKHTTRRGTHGTRSKLTPKEALEMEAAMERIFSLWGQLKGLPPSNTITQDTSEEALEHYAKRSRSTIKRRKPPNAEDESRAHRDLGGRMASRWSGWDERDQ